MGWVAQPCFRRVALLLVERSIDIRARHAPGKLFAQALLPKMPNSQDIISGRLPQEMDIEDVESWQHSFAESTQYLNLQGTNSTYFPTSHPATIAPSHAFYFSENMRDCKLCRTLLGREESDSSRKRLVRIERIKICWGLQGHPCSCCS